MKIRREVDEIKIEFNNKFTVKNSNIPCKHKIKRIYAKDSESEKSIINKKNLLFLKFNF